MIDLDEVQAGDILTVQDMSKNVIVAPVGVATTELMVEAFGTWIRVARTNRMGRIVPVSGVKIVGHQPGIVPL